MSENPATPAPWFVGETHSDDNGYITITVGPFEAKQHYEDTICEVWGDNHPGEANAHLIAAAPDMLELLIASRTSIAGDWRERRDALIAKAMGEVANHGE